MGPVIETAAGKLLEGLTSLGRGEHWVLKPQQLDASGRLWSPGIRAGVKPGSHYHLTEFFGPILGIMTAETLEEAVELQNAVDYGLTAGLHSLDSAEIGYWLDHVQAGNLYVNRGITGAIVQRQPFGGWKKSAVGAGTKAGGPNYLVGLGNWETVPSTAASPVASSGAARLLDAARTSGGAIPAAELEVLERSLKSDAAAWAAEFGTAKDVSGLSAERNVFRYLPLPVTVRLSEGEPLVKLVRVLAAGLLAGSAVAVSTAAGLPAALKAVLADLGIPATVEDDAAWLARAAGLGAGRLRLIGGDRAAVADAAGGRPDLAVYSHAVTEAGRVELLPFLHEQAVSITAHLTDGLI
jgi:RHH-type proline utilization regulon transcriptional repressor/proline dehydrogenase/delta 1-pyrroline-5-carboxylate dehydrogenase